MFQKTNNNLGLYIHLPFCARKCLFCSFVVAIAAEHKIDVYIDAVLAEAANYRGKKIHTCYLGGGTPSHLSDLQLVRLIDGLRNILDMSSVLEMTIEANPENLTLEKARLFKTLGFNRVSLGVQTFHDQYLKFLGRAHDEQKAKRALDLLRDAGHSNINVDLMYGFPKQTHEELVDDIKAVIALKTQHVSLYTLTVEPNSRFYATQMKLDDDQKLADDYTTVATLLPQHGLLQYEISNFARLGYESRHNQHYWLGGEYIGLGVGAHGYLNQTRYWHAEQLNNYLANPNHWEGQEKLDERTRLSEIICFGLRMREGVDASIIPDNKRSVIDQLIAQGLLTIANGRLKATHQGNLVLDELSVRLI